MIDDHDVITGNSGYDVTSAAWWLAVERLLRNNATLRETILPPTSQVYNIQIYTWVCPATTHCCAIYSGTPSIHLSPQELPSFLPRGMQHCAINTVAKWWVSPGLYSRWLRPKPSNRNDCDLPCTRLQVIVAYSWRSDRDQTLIEASPSVEKIFDLFPDNIHLGNNGEGKLRGHPANASLMGKWSFIHLCIYDLLL